MRELSFLQKETLMHKLAEAYGIDVALVLMFNGNARINLRVPEHIYCQSIDVLPVETRGLNAAKRAKLFTVGDLMDSLMAGSYIKGAGVGCRKEYFGSILRYVYENMSTAAQLEFIDELLYWNDCLIVIME